MSSRQDQRHKLRKRQAAESAAATTAYQGGLAALDWYTPGDEYEITDELKIFNAGGYGVVTVAAWCYAGGHEVSRWWWADRG